MKKSIDYSESNLVELHKEINAFFESHEELNGFADKFNEIGQPKSASLEELLFLSDKIHELIEGLLKRLVEINPVWEQKLKSTTVSEENPDAYDIIVKKVLEYAHILSELAHQKDIEEGDLFEKAN